MVDGFSSRERVCCWKHRGEVHRFLHEVHVATNKLSLPVNSFVSVQDIQSVCHAPQPPVNYIQTTQTAPEADTIRRSLFALLVVSNANTYAACMALGVDATTPFSMIAFTIRTPPQQPHLKNKP